MAKGKGIRKNYTSKGERPNVAKSTLNAVKAGRPPFEKMLNKVRAAAKGKRVFYTIENPNKEQKNRSHIKIQAGVSHGKR